MSVELQLRHDTAANVAAFTPAQAEVVVDDTNNRLCVGDGVTAGGWPAAKLSEVPLSGANWQFGQVGIGTAPDPSNPLSVYGPSALFNNAANCSFTINKGGSAGAAGDTASIIFEDGFSGRAQMGLNGSDNYSFKVSPNGSTWTTALAFDAATGAPVFANTRTPVLDANYLQKTTDVAMAYATLTASRVVTLAASATLPVGCFPGSLVYDETGNCSSAVTITLEASGTDEINGQSRFVVCGAFGYARLANNGGGHFTVVGADINSLFAALATALPAASGVAWVNATTGTSGPVQRS